jgi:transcriptional regulator with XRE-family HTH domain
MTFLFELSQAVRARRTDIGLTQTMLAKISGLSRATVNQLENGTVKDLSLTRASRLLEALGLSMAINVAHTGKFKKTSSSPLFMAALTASVSYRRTIRPSQIRLAFTEGKVSTSVLPHICTLLDEAPVSLLARVVEQLHVENKIERSEIWTQMRLLAVEFKSSRPLWT